MKRKTAAIFAAALVSASPLLGAASCRGVQEEVESPVREATQQVRRARDLQGRVEGVQQQQQQLDDAR